MAIENYTEEKKNLLEKLYNDPESPAAFSGVQRLYKEARKINPTISMGDVKYYMEGSRIYTMHKPRRKKIKRSKFIPSGFMTDFQVDLADFKNFAKYNRGYKYILVGICVLSKRFFAAPVKSKKPSDVKIAFKKIFNEMPMKPFRIFSDRGRKIFFLK